MSNLPNYKHQATYNDLEMHDWYPRHTDSEKSGAYKCLPGKKGEGNLCYLEIEGAGHVLSLDKPREGSLMITKWMKRLMLE
jgi:carboxypeptidase C (cathepsin A)